MTEHKENLTGPGVSHPQDPAECGSGPGLHLSSSYDGSTTESTAGSVAQLATAASGQEEPSNARERRGVPRVISMERGDFPLPRKRRRRAPPLELDESEGGTRAETPAPGGSQDPPISVPDIMECEVVLVSSCKMQSQTGAGGERPPPPPNEALAPEALAPKALVPKALAPGT